MGAVRRFLGLDPGAGLRPNPSRARAWPDPARDLPARPQEIHWFYQEGASRLFPDYWQDYIAPIPPDERDDCSRLSTSA
jgi:hypothetical protein